MGIIKTMKIMLTGANGFIGRYVLDTLQNHGIDVVAVGRNRPHVPVTPMLLQ